MDRNKKNNVYPCKPQFYHIKVGFKGVNIIYACFRDVNCKLSIYFEPRRKSGFIPCQWTVINNKKTKQKKKKKKKKKKRFLLYFWGFQHDLFRGVANPHSTFKCKKSGILGAQKMKLMFTTKFVILLYNSLAGLIVQFPTTTSSQP